MDNTNARHWSFQNNDDKKRKQNKTSGSSHTRGRPAPAVGRLATGIGISPIVGGARGGTRKDHTAPKPRRQLDEKVAANIKKLYFLVPFPKFPPFRRHVCTRAGTINLVADDGGLKGRPHRAQTLGVLLIRSKRKRANPGLFVRVFDFFLLSRILRSRVWLPGVYGRRLASSPR